MATSSVEWSWRLAERISCARGLDSSARSVAQIHRSTSWSNVVSVHTSPSSTTLQVKAHGRATYRRSLDGACRIVGLQLPDNGFSFNVNSGAPGFQIRCQVVRCYFAGTFAAHVTHTSR